MPSPPLMTGPSPPDISIGYLYVTTQWVTVSIATVLVALRICTRSVLFRALKWDDYAILVALACALAQAIISIIQLQNGSGRNIIYLEPTQIRNNLYYMVVVVALNLIGVFFVRISVCLFILQVIRFSKKIFHRWVYGLMVFFFLITAMSVFAWSFQCIPLDAVWDPSIHGRCMSATKTLKINQAQGVLSVIMDIQCVILPIMVIGKLQISLREKLGLSLVLGLGLFTAAAAAARTALYDFGSTNFTQDLVPDSIFACLEQTIGIIAACMPALRQLHKVLQRKRHAGHSLLAGDNCDSGGSKQAPLVEQAQISSMSVYETEVETKQDSSTSSPKAVSPRMTDSPRFGRPCVLPDQAETSQESRKGKSDEGNHSVLEQSRESSFGKTWSPRLMDSPHSHRPSLLPEQAQIIREYHQGKSKESANSLFERSRGSSFGKNWSPRLMDSPHSHRPSLLPEQARIIKEYHEEKSKQEVSSGPEQSRESSFGKSWSSRPIDSPHSHRPSLLPEQAQAIKEYHLGRSKENSKSVIEIGNKSGYGKGWSSRRMDSPTSHRPSLTPEQSRTNNECHSHTGKSGEKIDRWEAGRRRGEESLARLETRPGVGYSCSIEATSSRRLTP